ncbi:MAG: hypothetical protein C5B60_08385 [Chloroflexi bacterium]|nr:MAG: hypothetical protein C5B60_08385 [Chloroflexota bacterium]
MPLHDRGQQLRSLDGHFEMASFELKTVENGFWMWVSCEFDGHRGGHWLAPDPTHTSRVTVTSDPYCWESASLAYDARDRWEQQEEKRARNRSTDEDYAD